MRHLTLVVALCWPTLARAEPMRTVPLVVHVAEEGGVPVASDEFLHAQVEHANAIYRRLGVELHVVGRRRMPVVHARLTDRAGRDALGARLVHGVVNWFVVAQLMDVDEPGRERRGVHWRVRSAPRKRFVIVSAISGPYVLAHELGHFFGNRAHSDVPGNLMSYQQTGAEPVLDESQRAIVVRSVRMLQQHGALLSVQAARRALR